MGPKGVRQIKSFVETFQNVQLSEREKKDMKKDTKRKKNKERCQKRKKKEKSCGKDELSNVPPISPWVRIV